MSWVTVIWSMAAGVSLALAAVHLLVWLRDRSAIVNGLFSISAVAAAVLAGQELVLMRTQTPAEYAAVLRWMHLSAAVIVIAIVWFVRFYLGTGRLWLAWLVTLVRGVILIVNFVLPFNATFAGITELRQVSWLGEPLSLPIAEENPWRYLIHVATLLFVVYVLDAAIRARRLGKQRQAVTVGGGILVAIVLAAVFSGLMVRGVLPGPLIALVYLIVVVAMALELSVDLLRARETARELHDSRERMRLAAEAADLGLWEWDVGRDVIWTNEVVGTRTGLSGSGCIGLDSYLALIHGDDRERVEAALRRALVESGELHEEYRMINADGIERWFDALGRVEYDGQGRPLRVRGVSADISARKRLEAEALQQRDQLARAQRILALGQLSSALAHELNQPLGAILRNAEAAENFLRRSPPALDELAAILADIRHDDQRAAAVIDRMRAMLQQRPLSLEAIAPRELLQHVIASLDREIRSRRTQMYVRAPAGLPEIFGDRIQLQQVLINLLLNSLDAMAGVAEQRREIVVHADRCEESRVRFSVEDNGPGFPSERLSKLFDPYYTSKPDGIGLGLSISRTIVEAHGGRIHAENAASGGARVWFSLPVATEDTDTATVTRADVASSSTKAGLTSHEHGP